MASCHIHLIDAYSLAPLTWLLLLICCNPAGVIFLTYKFDFIFSFLFS